MKKVATLLAALMLMTAAFAGCGDTGSNSSAAETSTSSTVSETSASESESSAEAAGDETSSEASAAETGDYGEFTTVEEGKLIMATNAQFPPYEMVADGEGFNGTGFEGIDVEIASAIAGKLGLELQIDDMDFISAHSHDVANVRVSNVVLCLPYCSIRSLKKKMEYFFYKNFLSEKY